MLLTFRQCKRIFSLSRLHYRESTACYFNMKKMRSVLINEKKNLTFFCWGRLIPLKSPGQKKKKNHQDFDIFLIIMKNNIFKPPSNNAKFMFPSLLGLEIWLIFICP